MPCYLCPGFPVGNCQTIPDGTTCQADTINHPCVETGSFLFRCPSAAASGTPAAYSQRLSIGSHWGAGSYFELQSGDLGYDGNGFRKRNAELVSSTGGFDVKCHVCGVGTMYPQDTDTRPGIISVRLEFGPNVLNGVVNENVIQGYRIYMASDCSVKLSNSLAYVSASNSFANGVSVNGVCGCPSSSYSVQVQAQLPAGVNEGRLMIVPITSGGYELPMGRMTGLVQDNAGVTTTQPPFVLADDESVKVEGSCGVRIDCQYAADYVSRPQVQRAWEETVSDQTGVPRQYIQVFLRNRCPARRLALDSLLDLARGRILQGTSAGQVTVDYVITLPKSAHDDPSVPQVAAITQSMSAPDIDNQLSQLSSAKVDQQMAGTGVTFNTVVVWVNQPQSSIVSTEKVVNKGLIAGVTIGSVSGVWCVACLLFCLCCRKKPKKKEEADLIGTV